MDLSETLVGIRSWSMIGAKKAGSESDFFIVLACTTSILPIIASGLLRSYNRSDVY